MNLSLQPDEIFELKIDSMNPNVFHDKDTLFPKNKEISKNERENHHS